MAVIAWLLPASAASSLLPPPSSPLFAPARAAERPVRRSGVSANLGRDTRELRDDLLAVGGQRLLLALGHQVDVELVDADRLELLQLLGRLLGRSEDAKAVADLVGDELTVLRAHAAVLRVVVELARLYVVRERRRNLVRVLAVALDQVHDVVRDHRREPAHLIPRAR